MKMKIKRTKNIYRLACMVFICTLVLVVPVAPDNEVHADALPVSDSVIRVHLSSYGTPASVSMEAIGNHTIADNGQALSGMFTATVSGENIIITSGVATYSLDGDITILSNSKGVNDLIKINGGHSYAGDFRLIVKNGGIKIVNSIDYETYLIGVLPYEMSDTWPIEALKAQAVTARSYAYAAANSRDRAAQEHDVVNTSSSQVYYGYNPSYTNCIAAIAAVPKQILTDLNGNGIYTFYSASNGGHTEYPSATGVAASNPAYLPYKDDPYDWAYALSSTVYSAKLTLPKSFDVSLLKTSSVQPYAMFREKLTTVGIDVNSLTGAVNITGMSLDTPRYTNPDRVFTGADIALTVTDGSGAASAVTLSYECYTDASGVKRPFLNDVLNLSNKSRFSSLYLQDNGDNYLLASVRCGHGVGMSQIGANQMAKSGMGYGDILAFYYAMGTGSILITKDWTIDNGVTLAEVAKPAAQKFKSFKARVKLPGKGGKLNVRKGPSIKKKKIGSLKNKAKVTIIGKSGSWYKLKYKGKIGYVSKKYIKKI